MQLIVIAATMPSLLLMSRARAYPVLRIAGALFAGFASAGWIAERLFGLHTSVDALVGTVARHAVWIATVLFLTCLACWMLSKFPDRSSWASTAASAFDESGAALPIE